MCQDALADSPRARHPGSVQLCRPGQSQMTTVLRAPGGCVDVDQPSRSRLTPRCLVDPLRLPNNPDRAGVLLVFTRTQRTKPALNAFAITLEGRIPARRSSGSGSDR